MGEQAKVTARKQEITVESNSQDEATSRKNICITLKEQFIPNDIGQSSIKRMRLAYQFVAKSRIKLNGGQSTDRLNHVQTQGSGVF